MDHSAAAPRMVQVLIHVGSARGGVAAWGFSRSQVLRKGSRKIGEGTVRSFM